MNKQKKFGLVFEEHLPECTPLYEMPVNCGSNVALKSGNINDIYRVIAINNEKALCIKEDEKAEWNIADLVVVAKFGKPIYPYLKQIDSVCNAPDSDLWHTLIEAIVFILIRHIIRVRKIGSTIMIMWMEMTVTAIVSG